MGSLKTSFTGDDIWQRWVSNYLCIVRTIMCLMIMTIPQVYQADDQSKLVCEDLARVNAPVKQKKTSKSAYLMR